MQRRRWQWEVALVLVVLAVIFYALRWFFFATPPLQSEMVRFFIGDVAFLFIQVLIVTLFIDGLLQRRQQEAMLNKLNMVIGAFFTETGTDLLGKIAAADVELGTVRDRLVPTMAWGPSEFAAARAAFAAHDPKIELTACDLGELKATLTREKSYFLGMLGNQNLLEHESFSDLLWALTHLAEELAVRPDLGDLGRADALHLAGDVKRAYQLLGGEWIGYLQHLKTQYPYLFSLAVRTNPLDPQASVIVTE